MTLEQRKKVLASLAYIASAATELRGEIEAAPIWTISKEDAVELLKQLFSMEADLEQHTDGEIVPVKM